MLDIALKYQEELRRKFYDIWYDPEYQYYFGTQCRKPLEFSSSYTADKDLVSVDSTGSIVGYISYGINVETKVAYQFGCINFTKSNYQLFASDIMQAIDDIFCKFGCNVMEFNVIIGNKAEKHYDRLVKRLNGTILCQRHNRAVDLSGNLHDDKLYEITKEQYMNYKNRRK